MLENKRLVLAPASHWKALLNGTSPGAKQTLIEAVTLAHLRAQAVDGGAIDRRQFLGGLQTATQVRRFCAEAGLGLGKGRKQLLQGIELLGRVDRPPRDRDSPMP